MQNVCRNWSKYVSIVTAGAKFEAMIWSHDWLCCDLVKSRTIIIKFKVACLVRHSVSGLVPVYLADNCCVVSDSTPRFPWSADVPTCVVPRTLSSYGDRTFVAAGPRLWNSLPVQLCNPDITYGLFRRQLKRHLFRDAWTRRSVTSGMRLLRKTLTYLLMWTNSWCTKCQRWFSFDSVKSDILRPNPIVK